MDNRFYIGFNANCSHDGINKRFFLPTDTGKGVDFVLCHFDPDEKKTVEENCRIAEKAAADWKEHGVDFIANFEFLNFNEYGSTSDGFDWCNRPDGCHRLDIPDEYVKALGSSGNLLGIMYDEMEHILINRNVSLTMNRKGFKNVPLFPIPDTKDVLEQGKILDKQLSDYASGMKNKGADRFLGEHVFPVLFHKFARNGIIPNFKSQKESCSNVQFSIAAGAALQYETELFNCIDLWFILTFPGHSPEEMYHNLVFSYLAGINRAYVEHGNALVEKKENDEYEFTEYGKNFRRFADEYKGKDRGYCVQDYRPEIGIIRYDDSFWGQCDPVAWKKILFGNKKIKPNYKARELTKAMHLITHGETCPRGLAWNRISPWSLRKHRSFLSMNSAVVFDENVTKEKLSSLKLCFLCGYHISDKTLKAVSELVKENGLTVITTKRFAPEHILQKTKGLCSEVIDGKGKWIVTNRFLNCKIKKAVKPFIGNKGEIRLTFADREIRLKISENGETFTVIE